MKIVTNFWKGMAVVLALTACDKSHEGDLKANADASITSFKANGIEGIIDDAKQTITIYAPWSHDLTRMSIVATPSTGAIVSPANASEVDLSSGKIYRVMNGNLYWDYTAKAKYSEMLSFAIGNYKGKIDNIVGEITIKYPMGQPLTALTPIFTTTQGVTVTPASGSVVNFTTPVTYTMSYAGETFTYTVTVVPTSFQPLAFLGTAESASAISNADEKKAYQWFSENFDNHKYISFTDIKNGKVNLSDYKVIWWHLDGDTRDLPSDAVSTAVIDKMKTYYTNGGSFLFSSWAVQYVANLGIAKDGKIVNNMWGEGDAPFVTGDDWGICFKGNEMHPIFEGLSKKSGSDNVALLLSKGVKAKAHNAIWNFEWGDYANNIPRWTAQNGATNLASFHWNTDMNRACIFEYPKISNSGKTICIGIEGYDWFNEDGSAPNTYLSNIEILTSNILDYLAK